MKYIDVDRLREELQKPKIELKAGNYYLDNSEQAVGYENALVDFELLIDSLQREQPAWKPSEEQMDSLRDTIVQTKGRQYSMFLPELYEDLKKLM